MPPRGPFSFARSRREPPRYARVPSARPPAFSLVELVIVVVILGIIATIAMSKLGAASASVGETALRSSLKTARDAIDRYAAEHNGTLPGAKQDGIGNAALSSQAFINQLTLFSDLNGTVSPTDGAPYAYGPYLRRVPESPVGDNKGDASVAIDATHSPPLVTLGTEGWVYNPNTGEIIANSDRPTQDGNRTFDEF